MPPSQAPEKTDAGAAAPAPGAERKRLMSPAGYIVVAGVMAVTAAVVYFVTSSFHDTAPKPQIEGMYEELDLGSFARELAPDSVNLVREQFMVKVILVLNPNFKKLAEMKTLVEKRKNSLKDVIWREILHPKNDADLRKATVLESLSMEIRQRLNAELGASKEGQEMISKVIFPENRLPARR
jgi:flagellar basal body-associated protein FliL